MARPCILAWLATIWDEPVGFPRPPSPPWPNSHAPARTDHVRLLFWSGSPRTSVGRRRRARGAAGARRQERRPARRELTGRPSLTLFLTACPAHDRPSCRPLCDTDPLDWATLRPHPSFCLGSERGRRWPTPAGEGQRADKELKEQPAPLEWNGRPHRLTLSRLQPSPLSALLVGSSIHTGRFRWLL